MANERNVAALLEMLLASRHDTTARGVPAMDPDIRLSPADATVLAERLASRGVLVPSALTQGDLRRVIAIGMPPDPNAPGYEPLRAFFTGELGRIAKGETA